MRPFSEPRPSASGRAAISEVRRLGKLLLAVLRELSDETAYERHLAARGREHSGEEWRHFCEHRLRDKYARAKCC